MGRKRNHGDWGGPGVFAEPGPMDKILLKDYAPISSVVTQQTLVPKAKYPAIDSHVHVVAKTNEEIADWVKTMDEVGMEKSLVLTGAIGKDFDTLVSSLSKAYPGRFQLYCGLDKTGIEKPDYSTRIVEELERCYQNGAKGVGELTDKGFGIVSPEYDGNYSKGTQLSSDKRMHPDDERLDAFWEKCAELKMPVNLHIADHPSCWTPLNVYQERTPDYQHFNLFDKGVPKFNELIEKRNRTLENHPNTIFIACHMGNQGHDLTTLTKAMEKYVFFLCVMAAQTWALDSYSQVTRLSLNLKDTRVIDILGEIEEKTEFFFLFNQKLLDVERKVDIEVRQPPLPRDCIAWFY